MVGRWIPYLETRGYTPSSDREDVYTPPESMFASILFFDEKDAFVSFVKCELEREKEELNDRTMFSYIFERESKSLVAADEILHRVSYYGAVDCAAALINGETGQTVHLNVPCGNGVYPLHYAVKSCTIKLIERYLLLGARTDLRGICPISGRTNQLPLNTALSLLRQNWMDNIYQLGEESIFTSITLLCLPEENEYSAMQIIRLLASNTSETETQVEILQYAREGKLVELTALLIVTWTKLTNPARKCIITKAMDDKALLLLLQVVESAGDAIEAYAKQDKTDVEVSKEQIKAELQILLQQKGFVLRRRDIDFSEIERIEDFVSRHGLGRNLDWRFPPTDVGMHQFSRLGYRWPSKVTKEKVIEIKANSEFEFPTTLRAEVKKIVSGVGLYLQNVMVSKPWELVALVVKRRFRRG